MTSTVIVGVGLSDQVLSADPQHLQHARHVGRAESERLMGAGREYGRGPLPEFLNLAAKARAEQRPIGLLLIHDREAPNPSAPLIPFLRGAEVVQAAASAVPWECTVEALRRLTGSDPLSDADHQDVRFLIIGCHTEERVLATALFLRSILGYGRVATCPHLVGSAASEAHLAALRHHLPRAGIEVLLRLDEAASFAGFDGTSLSDQGFSACEIEPADVRDAIGETSRHIIQLLCLHWSRAQLRPLGGGFSGSLLLLASGWKGTSRTEPMVLKVDHHRQMRREIDGYHLVKDLLGKHVPTFDLPVLLEDSLGVGMELAAMEGAPGSLQDAFEEAESEEAAERFLRRLDKTLVLLSARLYQNTRRTDWVSPYRAFHLHTDMQQEWLAGNLDAIAGHWRNDTGQPLPVDRSMLAALLRTVTRNEDGLETAVCLAHGDLNLKNVICDHGDNVWLIDWTHSGRNPVELDFAKMESDVKFVMSKAFTLEDLPHLRQLEEHFVEHRVPPDLSHLPEALRFVKWDLRFRKIVLAVRRIRETCFALNDSTGAWVMYRAALLKYALHTLSFDRRRGRGECELPQLMYALHSVEALLNELVVDDFHLRIRGERPSTYPPRQRVTIDAAPWAAPCPDYDPPYFVSPVVLANDCSRVPGGWADPEDVSTIPPHAWPTGVQRDDRGRPLHPFGRTGIAGRGALGRWGPNVAVVGIVTRPSIINEGFEVLLCARRDSDLLEAPQDFVRAGEESVTAWSRTMREATGWQPPAGARVLREGYDYDARRTDHAWVVTRVAHLHVLPDEAPDFFQAGGPFESVFWYGLNAETINRVPAATARHLRDVRRSLDTSGHIAAETSAVLVDTA